MVPQAWAPTVASGTGQAVCKVSSYYSSYFPGSQEQSSKLSQGIPPNVSGDIERGGAWPSLVVPQAQARSTEAEGHPRPMSKERPL